MGLRAGPATVVFSGWTMRSGKRNLVDLFDFFLTLLSTWHRGLAIAFAGVQPDRALSIALDSRRTTVLP
jgi:hypothetical protein